MATEPIEPEFGNRDWEDRIKQIENSQSVDGHNLDLLLDAGWIAIKTVIQAAKAGNVQCREATLEIMPILKQIKKT